MVADYMRSTVAPDPSHVSGSRADTRQIARCANPFYAGLTTFALPARRRTGLEMQISTSRPSRQIYRIRRSTLMPFNFPCIMVHILVGSVPTIRAASDRDRPRDSTILTITKANWIFSSDSSLWLLTLVRALATKPAAAG